MKTLSDDESYKIAGGATSLGPFTLTYVNSDPNPHQRLVSQPDSQAMVGVMLATVLSPNLSTYGTGMADAGLGTDILITSMELDFPT